MAGDAALRIVVAQAGTDVVAFVDTDGDRMPDLAIILTGVGLGTIDASNFV